MSSTRPALPKRAMAVCMSPSTSPPCSRMSATARSVPCELARPDVESAEAGTVELARRVAGDQRAVEVEERGDAARLCAAASISCDPLTQVAHASPLVSCCDERADRVDASHGLAQLGREAVRRSRGPRRRRRGGSRLAARRSADAKSSRETDSGVVSRPAARSWRPTPRHSLRKRSLLDGLAAASRAASGRRRTA